MSVKYELVVGAAINRLTLIRFVEGVTAIEGLWEVQCSCGSPLKILPGNKLRYGRPNSCGCFSKEHSKKLGESFKACGSRHVYYKEDLSNTKVNNLTIISFDIEKRKWKCLCDCGNITYVAGNWLKGEKHTTLSCGCKHREKAAEQGRTQGKLNTTHGKTGTSEYFSWRSIKQRCFDINDPNYPYYGGKGITMCSTWVNSFEKFFKDLGSKPSKKHTVDRINNSGNYTKDNCKWSSHKEQQRNRSSNVIYTIDNITLCLTEWCEKYNISMQLVWGRINKLGWEISKALTTPVKKRTKRFAPEKHTWQAMINRCSPKGLKDYAGRGICVCLGWKSYENFIKDMGLVPDINLSLDRIDVNGNYSCGKCEECFDNNWPLNCRWTDNLTQGRNKRSCHYLIYNGETRCISDWVSVTGLKHHVITTRLKLGWSIEDTLSLPLHSRRKK